MNIVTIFDYDVNKKQNIIMFKMLIDSIKKNTNKSCEIYVITKQPKTIETIDKTINLLEYRNFITDKKIHRNITDKLYNLCNLNFEFIFLDYDMYVCSDLNFLWERRKDKPFIATVHQKNICGTKGVHTTENSDFLNSGLQIVSDPDFLNYEKIFQVGENMNFKFPVSGNDQALLNSYFDMIGYEFQHEDIGCEWNSCAGYGVVYVDKEYDFNIIYRNQETEYPVMINHYWDEFKPWNINCPIFNFYKEYIL